MSVLSRSDLFVWATSLLRARTQRRSQPVLSTFALLLVICFAFSALGAETVQTETSPLQGDLAQQLWLRSQAKQTQERRRFRIDIPRPALQSGLAETTRRVGSSQDTATINESVVMPGSNVLLFAIICLACLLSAHKLAPGSIDAFFARLFPGSAALGYVPRPAELRAEQEAFAKFLVSFRAGPAARPSQQAAQAAPAAERPDSKAPEPLPAPTPKLFEDFFTKAPDQLTAMRKLLLEARNEAADAAQRQQLRDLRARLRDLVNLASAPELLPIWQIASVTQALVDQLVERTRVVAPNSLRTVSSGLELLVDLGALGPLPTLATEPPIRILAVDDDLISRHAVGLALKKAFNQPDLAANSLAALAQASMIAYDVIFLDILMPGMDGFELCSKLHETALNHLTPVVFVTGQTDLDSRAKSNLCGGTDFISKPFLTFEVTVKALVFALRGRLEKRGLAHRTASTPPAANIQGPATNPLPVLQPAAS